MLLAAVRTYFVLLFYVSIHQFLPFQLLCGYEAEFNTPFVPNPSEDADTTTAAAFNFTKHLKHPPELFNYLSNGRKHCTDEAFHAVVSSFTVSPSNAVVLVVDLISLPLFTFLLC